MPYKDAEKGRAHRKQYYLDNRDEIIKKKKKYYSEHREEMLQQRKEEYYRNHDRRIAYNLLNKEKKSEWYFANRDWQLSLSKQRNQAVRAEVIARYGGKCVFCGDSNANHLSVDHINNDGNVHRRTEKVSKIGLYRWLIKNNFPDGFQLLCFTHNFEKGHYGTMTPMEFNG